MNEDFLRTKLQERLDAESFRSLRLGDGVDLCSNDYLGIVNNELIKIAEKGQEKLRLFIKQVRG
jgi:hypothetical protein